MGFTPSNKSVLKSYESLHENVENIFSLWNPLPTINTEKHLLHINQHFRQENPL